MDYNLKEMRSSDVFIYDVRYEKENIYYYSADEEGKEYCILKNDFDLEEAKHDYIGTVPVNYIVASQMPNALDSLGLVKINGTIQLKRNIIIKKQNSECCFNCQNVFSEAIFDAIKKENSEYINLTDEEFLKQMGFCEFQEDEETVKNMGYWCPFYIKDERLEEQGPILKKIK